MFNMHSLFLLEPLQITFSQTSTYPTFSI